jgi:hypothetical protein
MYKTTEVTKVPLAEWKPVCLQQRDSRIGQTTRTSQRTMDIIPTALGTQFYHHRKLRANAQQAMNKNF